MAEYKLKKWQNELDELVAATGFSYNYVCDYLGLHYEGDIGFYVKQPRKRDTYIGIGMAFRRSLETINTWIETYGAKKKLYSKDLAEDLVWIYLINLNENTTDSSLNLYSMYSECHQAAMDAYYEIWDEIIGNIIDTADVDRELANVGEQCSASDVIAGIKDFVIKNLDAFRTAYAKPRNYLHCFLDSILETGYISIDKKPKGTVESLRGWLDDSMINYLTGSRETFNVRDNRTGRLTPYFKKMPRGRKTHIAMCLALGLTAEDINTYLEMMGFGRLTADDIDEENLIYHLEMWEDEHPVQRRFKQQYVFKTESKAMSEEEKHQAVTEMLSLRQELKSRYHRKNMSFIYMK